MRDLSGSRIQPMSPTMTGGFFTTEPGQRSLVLFVIVVGVESTFFLGKQSHIDNGEVTQPIFPVTVPY